MDSRIDELNRVAAKIVQQVDAAVDRWRSLPEQSITFRPSKDAWSVKEIIGHLIDSASNNHQRFVRLQLVDRLDFPDYGDENVNWVKIQNYQAQKWEELIGLWRFFNRHLAHTICSVDPACLNHFWQVDPNTRFTLFELMIDYLRHLELHLNQITETLEAAA
jgi:hypothetical protein